MKTLMINKISFKADSTESAPPKSSKKNHLIYPAMQGTGAICGYNIPIKLIDGSDVVSKLNGSNRFVMAKTKIPNIIGKWKNALLGAFIGTGLVMIYDYLKNKKN